MGQLRTETASQHPTPNLVEVTTAHSVERSDAELHLGILSDAAAILNANCDFDTALSRLGRSLVPTLADWCLIDCTENDWTFRRARVLHADPAKAQLAEELKERFVTEASAPIGVGHVIRTGRAEVYGDLSEKTPMAGTRDPEHPRILKELGAHSLIIAPIECHGKTQGAITFVSTNPDRPLKPCHLPHISQLSHCIGLALENAQLRQIAQRERAHAEAISLYKDEFLGMISHELRTPLQAILGWTQLLRENKLNRQAAGRALESLERNVKSQAQIINDLLDVSHIGTGRLKLEIQPIELRPVIQAALDTLKLSIQAKRISLLFTCEPQTPAVINGDGEWVQRVIWNLVSNAIKFTPDGGQISVELKHDSVSAQIRVADTGKGIAPEFLPHIFERFRQKDSSTTRSFGGLGIGLTIVRHITEAHGGTIQAESRGENQGAAFTLRLPISTRRPSGGTRSSVRSTPDQQLFFPPTLSGVRVLIVEDEGDTRDLISLVLEQAGAKITQAPNAAEAFKIVKKGKQDVLVSDIGMPGEDGYSFIRHVRTLTADQGGRIPALALTAYARTEDRIKALAAGFQMHIPKPVEPDELVLAISSLATRVVS
jgi:CheY-like chemotaxis protein